MFDIEKFKESINNGSFDKYFEKIAIKDNLKKSRFFKFEKWLETNSFEKLMDRLIEKYESDEWYEKCSNKGCEVYADNILAFVRDYVYSHGEIQNTENEDFATIKYSFKGYMFETVFGQGSVDSFYKIEKSH